MNSYVQGTLVRLVAAIATSSRVPVDPTTVTLQVQTPDLIVSNISGSIVHDGVGNYHCDYTTAQIGDHQYEWGCNGIVTVNTLGKFSVLAGL